MLRRAVSPLTLSSSHLMIFFLLWEATGPKPAQLLYRGALTLGTMIHHQPEDRYETIWTELKPAAI